MKTSVKTILMSSSPAGTRMATFECVFPRMMLAEMNTHGSLSKNSASSRAIPPEKMIEQALYDPYIPKFRERTTGMGAGPLLSQDEQDWETMRWLSGRDRAVEIARGFIEANVSKSQVNRCLEPYIYHTAIISGTHWGNFLGLRCPPGDVDPDFPALTDFQELAILIRDQLHYGEVQKLEAGQWHLPYVTAEDRLSHNNDEVFLASLSAGRNARVSYAKHADDESWTATLARAESMSVQGHFSPLEHPAMALDGKLRWGKLVGFKPFRNYYPGEHDASLKRPDLDWIREYE